MPKNRLWQRSLVLGLTLVIAGAAVAEGDAGNEDFPRYETIRPNVEFWTRVFAEWSLGQVVVHDLDHPGVVYDVVDLPGPVEERYTEEQRDFIDDLNELWEHRLLAVEKKIRAKSSLDDQEKAWVLSITTNAGTDKVDKAHKRVRTQRGLRERFRRGLEISQRYDGRIREELRRAGLPEEIAFLPHVESSFQAAARSSAGAVGVWQFTRGTGKLYLKINSAVDERLDPIAASRGAARYLLDAHARLNNWPLALTAYNHGVAGMARAVKKLGNDYEKIFLEYDGRLFGFASKNFYSEFLAAMDVAGDPERFFPEGLNPEPPLDLDQIVLDRPATPAGIARAYGLRTKELAGLNPAWTRRAVRSALALPRGLTVWLPAGTLARAGGEARIPAVPAGVVPSGTDHHVVRRGETLSTIARAYGISLSKLRGMNGIPAGKSLIRVGQKLRVGEAGRHRIHVVRAGESLSSIAARYGMQVGALRSLNGMRADASLIRIGQRLRVDGGTGSAVHVVRRGDTLLRIALRHRVRLSTLLDLNQLSERSVIHPGQSIRIPSRR